MKEFILDVVKGVLIGVANVIPGVSGGTLAVSTGVYEKILNAINSLRKEFKNSIKTLFPFVIGIAIGVVALAFVITMLLERYTIPTIACFIGLVLGGVPPIVGKIKDEKIKWTHIVSFILTLAIIIVPTIVAINTPAVTKVEFNLINSLIFGALGIISAGAMVVPGVSGSMVLMMLGYYESVITSIKNAITYIVHFDFTSFFAESLILIPFGIGVLLGIIIISKIISFFLKRYPNASHWGILGLIVASPFAIIIKAGLLYYTPLNVLAAIITFLIGFLISTKLGEK